MENVNFSIEARTQFWNENKVGFGKFDFERRMYVKYLRNFINRICDKYGITVYLKIWTTDTREDGNVEYLNVLNEDIAIVARSFDVSSYLSLGVKDKTSLLFKLVRDSYGIVLTELNYEADIIISFMQDLQQLENQFQFNEVIAKFKTDVNRRNKIEIVISGNIENLEFYFHLVDLKSLEEDNILFCEMHPYHFESHADYRRLVMKGQWISVDTYRAENYSKEIFHEYNLVTKKIKVTINPTNPINKEWLENKYRLYTTKDKRLMENIIIEKEW